MSERSPQGLGKSGKALWKALTDEYEFNAGERQTLKSACQQADWIAKLEDAAKDADMLVMGSAKQWTLNPLISEARQARQTLNTLITALRLPSHPTEDDDEYENVTPMDVGKSAIRRKRGS